MSEKKRPPQANWPPKIEALEADLTSRFEAAFGALLARKLTLAAHKPTAFDAAKAAEGFAEGAAIIKVGFSGGRAGGWYFLMPAKFAALFAQGEGEEQPAEFDPVEHWARLSEAFTQVTLLFEHDLIETLGAMIKLDPPQLLEIPFEELGPLDGQSCVEWTVKVENWGEAPVWKVLEAYGPFAGDAAQPSEAAAGSQSTIYTDKAQSSMKAPPIAKSAEFEEFSSAPPRDSSRQPRNLNLLLDISLPISIELGRTNLLVREVLELGPGSVIELDKLSGEPVDLYVNDKRFAKGEVVVIEENFGVRITELLKMEERIQALG